MSQMSSGKYLFTQLWTSTKKLACNMFNLQSLSKTSIVFSTWPRDWQITNNVLLVFVNDMITLITNFIMLKLNMIHNNMTILRRE